MPKAYVLINCEIGAEVSIISQLKEINLVKFEKLYTITIFIHQLVGVDYGQKEKWTKKISKKEFKKII